MKKFATIAVAASVMLSGAAHAATLTIDVTTQNGSADMPGQIVLEDIAGGVRFNVSLNTVSAQSGDIVAVYADILGDPAASSSYTVGPSTVVTGFDTDTKNIQAGNIGREFDFGFAIGETGLKGGADRFQMFSFDITAVGLDVADFLGQTFALRGQSIGANGDSAKQFGFAPTTVDIDNTVPIPGAGVMLLGGLSALTALRRRKA
jgi:hypothetical protein